MKTIIAMNRDGDRNAQEDDGVSEEEEEQERVSGKDMKTIIAMNKQAEKEAQGTASDSEGSGDKETQDVSKVGRRIWVFEIIVVVEWICFGCKYD